MDTPFYAKPITISQNSANSVCDADCDCDCTRLNIFPDWNQDIPLITSTLTSVYLELTPACNSRCVGCSNVFIADKITRQMEASATPLDITAWQNIIGKLAPHINRLSITGGEPTLYKYFNQFIKLLDEYGLTYTLFTNARWLNPQETLHTLSRAKGLRGLLISLHGQDAATHEAFTLAPGSFAETLENIRLASQAGISLTLSSIINGYSYAQSEAIYKLGKSMGVRRVVFNRYVGLVDDPCAPAPSQLKQALTAIEAMRLAGKSVKLSTTVPQCFHSSSATGCGAGENFVTLDPWGNAKPCNHTPMILGNLRYDSVADIMGSSQLVYWRNLTPAHCTGCSAYSLCKGGCRAEAMLNQSHGDTLIQQPFSVAEGSGFYLIPDHLHPQLIQPISLDEVSANCSSTLFDECIRELDGSMTLKEVGMIYGQESLDLIGSLYQAGYVQFM